MNQKGVIGVMRKVTRTEGIGGLFKGYASTILRDVPYSAIYWSMFETLKPIYLELLKNRGNSNLTAVSFISGEQFSPTTAMTSFDPCYKMSECVFKFVD